MHGPTYDGANRDRIDHIAGQNSDTQAAAGLVGLGLHIIYTMTDARHWQTVRRHGPVKGFIPPPDARPFPVLQPVRPRVISRCA